MSFEMVASVFERSKAKLKANYAKAADALEPIAANQRVLHFRCFPDGWKDKFMCLMKQRKLV